MIELRRKDSSLSGPDHEQISILVNNIESLHLSTEDGSFLVTFDSHLEEQLPTPAQVDPTGICAIKDIPLASWISRSDDKYTIPSDKKQSIFHHLLSLPLSDYLASQSDNEREKKSIFNHLLSLPLHDYLASPSTKKSTFDRTLLHSFPKIYRKRFM